MPPTSHERAIATAIKVLRLLWNRTSSDDGLTKTELVRACAEQGMSLDTRLLFSIVDGAADAGAF